MTVATFITGPHRPVAVEPNENAGWLGREPTVDEREVVDWMRKRQIPRRILHVGVGTAFLSKEFGDNVRQGITKDGGEAASAKALGLKTILCNKYDVASYSALLDDPFDCIVDVNIRSYACCDEHFHDYVDRMMLALNAGGMLLTSRCGLDYLVPTSIESLRLLCPKWRITTHGNVVVMRPGFRTRLAKWYSERSRSRAVEPVRPTHAP